MLLGCRTLCAINLCGVDAWLEGKIQPNWVCLFDPGTQKMAGFLKGFSQLASTPSDSGAKEQFVAGLLACRRIRNAGRSGPADPIPPAAPLHSSNAATGKSGLEKSAVGGLSLKKQPGKNCELARAACAACSICLQVALRADSRICTSISLCSFKYTLAGKAEYCP